MKRLLLITIFLVAFLCSCSNKHCEHKIVIDEAVEATCTSSGLSEGSHCSKCGEIIQKTVSIPALGHTTDAGTCKRCGISFGIWKIENYVNKFNEETYREYITTDKKLEGTFNNSATTDSMLKADILVDSLGVSIVLYEYGDRQVKSSLSTDYQISVKYGSKTETVSGELSNDRIKVYGDSKNESIICALASGKTVKFYIEETKNPITNYSFTVESSNFKDRYTEAIGLLEDENTTTYMPPTTPAEVLTEEELKYREAADLARKFDYESAYNTLLEIQDYKNISDLLPLLENPLYGVYQCEDSSSYIYLCNVSNLRSYVRPTVETKFSLSRPGVAPERAIGTDGGNGASDFVNNILDSTTAAPAISKEADADKTVFQGSNQLSGVSLVSIFVPRTGT